MAEKQVKFQLGVDARAATRDLRAAGTNFKSFSKGLTKDITHASTTSANALGQIGEAAVKQKNIVSKAFSGLSSTIKGVFMRTVDAVHFEITQRLTNAVLNGFNQIIQGGGDLQDEFEAIMTGVQKTAGLTYEKNYALGMELRRLASEELSVSAAELAKAADVAAHLGIVNSQAAIKDMTKFITTLSDASLALPEFAGGVEQIADVIGKQLNIFGVGADKAEEFLNVMDALSNTAATDAAQISEFMATFTEAKRLGLAQHQVAALGASLTSLGKRANAAGTQLQTAFLNLMTTGMDSVQELLGDKGFDRWQQVFLQDKVAGLEVIMERLRGLGEFEASSYMNKIFGKIGLKAVGSLIDPNNFAMIKKHMATAADQSRLFAQGLEDAYIINKEMEILQNSQRFYADRIRNAWNEVKIIMAERIEPLITGFNKNMAPVLTAFASLLKGVEELRQTEEAIDRIGQAGMYVLEGFKNILVQLGIFRAGTNQLHFILVGVFDTILSGIGLLEHGVQSFGDGLQFIAGTISLIQKRLRDTDGGVLSSITSIFKEKSFADEFAEQHAWVVKTIDIIGKGVDYIVIFKDNIKSFGKEFEEYLGKNGRTQIDRFMYLLKELSTDFKNIFENLKGFFSSFVSEFDKSFSLITVRFDSSRTIAQSLAVVFTSLLTVINKMVSKVAVFVAKINDLMIQFRKGFEEGVRRGILEQITFQFSKMFGSISFGISLVWTKMKNFGAILYSIIPLSTRIGDTWDLLKVKVTRAFESIERLYLKHFFGERLDRGRNEPVFVRKLGQSLGTFVKKFPEYLENIDVYITQFSETVAAKLETLTEKLKPFAKSLSKTYTRIGTVFSMVRSTISQTITYIDLSLGLFSDSVDENVISPIDKMKDKIYELYQFVIFQVGLIRKGFVRGFLEAFGQDSIEKVTLFVESFYKVLSSLGTFVGNVFIRLREQIQRPLEEISFYYEAYLAGSALGKAARVIVQFGQTVYNVFDKVREVFQKVAATEEFAVFAQNLIRLRNMLLSLVQKISPPYIAMVAMFVKLLPLLNKVFSVIKANSGVIIAAMAGISVAVKGATEDTTAVANWIVTHVITPVNNAFTKYDQTIASFRETIKQVTENVVDLVRVFQWWFTTEFGEEGIELLRQNMENLGRIISTVSELIQTLIVRFRDVEKQEAPNMFQRAGNAARELARALKLVLSVTATMTESLANVLGNIRPFIEGIHEGFGDEGVRAIRSFSHHLVQALLITRDILTTIVPELRGFFNIFKVEGTSDARELGNVIGQVFQKVAQILEGLSKDLVSVLSTIKSSVEEIRAYFDKGFFGYLNLQIQRLIKNFKSLGKKIGDAMSPIIDAISGVVGKLFQLGDVAYGNSILPEMADWFGIVGESAAFVTDGIADLSKEMGDAAGQDIFGPIEVLGSRLGPVTDALSSVKDGILDVKRAVDEKVQTKGLEVLHSVLSGIDNKVEGFKEYKKEAEDYNALAPTRERYFELQEMLEPIREIQEAGNNASAEAILHAKSILQHQMASRDMAVSETRAIADYLQYQEGLKEVGLKVSSDEMTRVKDQLREMSEVSQQLGFSLDNTNQEVEKWFAFDYSENGTSAAMLEWERANEKQNVFINNAEKLYDKLIVTINKVKMSITGIIDSLLGVEEVAYGHSVLPELVDWFSALLSPINAVVNQILILAGAIQGKLSASQAIIMSLSNLFSVLVSPIALVIQTLKLGVAVVREFLTTMRDLLQGQVTLGEVVFGTIRDSITALTIPIQVLIGNFMEVGAAINYIGDIAYGHSVFPMLSNWLDIADTKVSQLADSFRVIGATIGRVMIEVNKAYSQSIMSGITPEFFKFDVRQILDPMLISEGLGKFEYDVARFVTQAFADLPSTLGPIMYDLSEIWREFSSLMIGTAEQIYDFGVMVKESYLKPIGEGLKEIGIALGEIYIATRPLISIFTYMWGDWLLKIPAAISLVIYFRKEVLKLFTDPQAVLEQFFDTLSQRMDILETAFKRLYRVFKSAILAIVPAGFQEQVSKIFQNFEKEIRYTYEILQETASKTIATVLKITDKVFTWINEKTRIFDFNKWLGNQIAGGLKLILAIPTAVLKTVTFVVDHVSYAMSAVATAVWTNKDKIWNAIMSIKDSLMLWGEIISDTADGIREDLHNILQWFISFATSLPGKIAKVGESIGGLIASTQEFFSLLKTNPVAALNLDSFAESLKRLLDQFGHVGRVMQHVLGVKDIDKSLTLVENFGDSFAKTIAHALRLRNLLFALGGTGAGVLSDLNGWFAKIQNWTDTWFGVFKIPARFRAQVEGGTKSVKGFEMSLGRISRIWHDIVYAVSQNTKWIDNAIDGAGIWKSQLMNITKDVAPGFAKLGKSIKLDFQISDFISAEALDQLIDTGDATDDLTKAFVTLKKTSPEAFEYDQMNKFSQYLVRIRKDIGGSSKSLDIFGGILRDIGKRLQAGTFTGPLAKGLGRVLGMFKEGGKTISNFYNNAGRSMRALDGRPLERAAQAMSNFIKNTTMGEKTLRQFLWSFRLDSVVRWGQILRDMIIRQNSAFGQWARGTKIVQYFAKAFEPLTRSFQRFYHVIAVSKPYQQFTERVSSLGTIFTRFQGWIVNLTQRLSNFARAKALSIFQNRFSGFGQRISDILAQLRLDYGEFVDELWGRSQRVGQLIERIGTRVVGFIRNHVLQSVGNYRRLLESEMYTLPTVIYNNYLKIFDKILSLVSTGGEPGRLGKAVNAVMKFLETAFSKRLGAVLVAPYKVAINFVRDFVGYMRQPVKAVQQFQKVGEMYAKPITIITSRFSAWSKAIAGVIKYFNPLGDIFRDITAAFRPLQSMPDTTTILMRRIKAIFPTLLNIVAVFAKWKYVLGDFVNAYKSFVGEFNAAGEIIKYPDPAKAVGYIIAGLVRLKTYSIKLAIETAEQFAGLLQQGLMMFLDDDADKGIRKFFGNIRANLRWFMQAYEDAMAAIPELVAYIFSTVQGILQGQITEFHTGWEKLIATVTLAIKALVGTVVGVFKAITMPFYQIWMATLALIEGDTMEMWKRLGMAIRDFLLAPIAIFKPAVQTLGQYLAGMVGMAGNPFESFPAFAKFAGKAVIQIIIWSVHRTAGIIKDLFLGLVTSVADIIWTVANPWALVIKTATYLIKSLFKTILGENHKFVKALTVIDRFATVLITPFSTLRDLIKDTVGWLAKLWNREPTAEPNIPEYKAKVTDISDFADHTRDAMAVVEGTAQATHELNKETEALAVTAYKRSTYPDIAKYAEIAGDKISLLSKITQDVRNVTALLGSTVMKVFKPLGRFISPIIRGFSYLIDKIELLSGGLLRFGDIAYGHSVLPETAKNTKMVQDQMSDLSEEVRNTSNEMSQMYIPGSDASRIAKLKKLFEVQNDIVNVPDKIAGAPIPMKGSAFDSAMKSFGIESTGGIEKTETFKGIKEAMVEVPEKIVTGMKGTFDFYLEHANEEVASRIENAMKGMTESEFYKKAPEFLEEIQNNLSVESLKSIGYGANDVEALIPEVGKLANDIRESSDNIELYLKDGVKGLVKQASEAERISDDSIKTVLKLIGEGRSPADIDAASSDELYKMLADNRENLYRLQSYSGKSSADFAKGSAIADVLGDLKIGAQTFKKSAINAFNEIVTPVGEVLINKDNKFFEQYASHRTDISKLDKFSELYTIDIEKAQEVFSSTTEKLIDFVESSGELDAKVKSTYIDTAKEILGKNLEYIERGTTKQLISLKEYTKEIHEALDSAGTDLKKFGSGIHEYTTTSYRLINSALSGMSTKGESLGQAGARVSKSKDAKKIQGGIFKKFKPKDMTKFLDSTIENIKYDLSNLDDYIGTTYRTLNLPNKKAADTFAKNLISNIGELELDRFTSTTMNPKYATEWGNVFAKQVLLEIDGYSGKGLGVLQSYTGEMEVLFNRGVKLNLVGVQEVFDGFAPRLLLKFKEGIVDNADVVEDAVSELAKIVQKGDIFRPFKYDYAKILKIFSGAFGQSAVNILTLIKNGFVSLIKSVPQFTTNVGEFFSKLAIENTSFLDKLGRFGDILSFVVPIITAFRNGEDVMQGFARGLSQITLPLTVMFTKGQGIYSIFGRFIGKLLPVFGTKLATVSSGVGTFIMTLEGVFRIGDLVFGLLEKFISRYPKLSGILPIVQGIHGVFSKLTAVFDVFYKVQEKVFFSLLSIIRSAGEYVGIWKFIGGSINIVLGAINKLLDAIIHLGDIAFGNSVFPEMVMWIERVKESLLGIASPIELGVKALKWFGKVAYGQSVLPETEKRVIALKGEFYEAKLSVTAWTKALEEAEKGVGAFAGAPALVKKFLDKAITRYEAVIEKIPGDRATGGAYPGGGDERSESDILSYFRSAEQAFKEQKILSRKERFTNLDPKATVAILELSKSIEDQQKPGVFGGLVNKILGAPDTKIDRNTSVLEAAIKTGNKDLIDGLNPSQIASYFNLAERQLRLGLDQESVFKMDKESLKFLAEYQGEGLKGTEFDQPLKDFSALAKKQLENLNFIESQSEFIKKLSVGSYTIKYEDAEGKEISDRRAYVGDDAVFESNLKLAEFLETSANTLGSRLKAYEEAGGDVEMIEHLRKMISLSEESAKRAKYTGHVELMREAEMASMEEYMQSLKPGVLEKVLLQPTNRLINTLSEIPRLIVPGAQKLVEERAPVRDELEMFKITEANREISEKLDYMRTAYVEGSDHLVDELAAIGAQIYDISPEQFLQETVEGLTLQRQLGTEGPVGGADIEMLAQSLRERTEAQIDAITTEGGNLLGDIAKALKATRTARIGELITAVSDGISGSIRQVSGLIANMRLTGFEKEIESSFQAFLAPRMKRYHKAVFDALGDAQKSEFAAAVREAMAKGGKEIASVVDEFADTVGVSKRAFDILSKQEYEASKYIPKQLLDRASALGREILTPAESALRSFQLDPGFITSELDAAFRQQQSMLKLHLGQIDIGNSEGLDLLRKQYQLLQDTAAKNARTLLGVADDASVDDIAKAYKQLAWEVHPDIAGEAAAETFRRVNDAFESVRDSAQLQRAVELAAEAPDVAEAAGAGTRGVARQAAYTPVSSEIVSTLVQETVEESQRMLSSAAEELGDAADPSTWKFTGGEEIVDDVVDSVQRSADETSTIVTRLFDELKRAPRGFFNFIMDGLKGGGEGVGGLFKQFDQFSGKHPVITFFYSLPKLLLRGVKGITKMGFGIIKFFAKPFVEVGKSLDYILGISAKLGIKWNQIGDAARGISFGSLLEAIKNLGRSGGTLIANMFEPITKFFRMDLGGTIGFKSISSFMDRLGGLRGIFGSLGKGLVQSLGPVGDIMDFLSHSWSSIVNTVQLLRGQTVDLSDHISNLAKGAAKLVLPFLEARALGATMGRLFGRLVARLLPRLGVQISAVAGSGGIAGLLLIIEGLAYAIRGVFGWTEKWLLQWKGNPIADALRTIVGIIRNLADVVVSAFQGIYKIFEDTFMHIFKSLGKGFQDIVVGVLQLWDAIKAAFRGDWSRVWDSFKDGATLVLKGLYTSIVETIGGGVLALLKSIWNRVVGMIDYMKVNWKVWKTESARAIELEGLQRKRALDIDKQNRLAAVEEEAAKKRAAAEEEYKMARAAAKTAAEEREAREAYEERMAFLKRQQIISAQSVAEQFEQQAAQTVLDQQTNRFGVYTGGAKEEKKGAGWKFWEKGAIPVDPTKGWEEVMAAGGRGPQAVEEQPAPQAGEKGGKGMFPSFDVPDMEDTVSGMTDDVKTAQDILLESWGVDLEQAQIQIAKQITLTRNNAVDTFVASLATLPRGVKDAAKGLPPVSIDDYVSGAEAKSSRDYDNIGIGRAEEAKRYAELNSVRQGISQFVSEMSGATESTVRSLMDYENSLVNMYARLSEAGTQEADKMLNIVERVTTDETVFENLAQGLTHGGETAVEAIRSQLEDAAGRSLSEYEDVIFKASQESGRNVNAIMLRDQEQKAFRALLADALQKDTAAVLGLFQEQAELMASESNKLDVIASVFGPDYDARMGEAFKASAANFRKNADPYVHSIEMFMSESKTMLEGLGFKEHVLRRNLNVDGVIAATDEVYTQLEKAWGAQYTYSKELISSIATLGQAAELKDVQGAVQGALETFYSRASGDTLQKEFFMKMSDGEKKQLKQMMVDRKVIAADTKLEDVMYAGFSSDKVDDFFLTVLDSLREHGADEGLIKKIFGDADDVALLMNEAVNKTGVLRVGIDEITSSQKEYNEALREAERLQKSSKKKDDTGLPKTVRANAEGFAKLAKEVNEAASPEELAKRVAAIRDQSHAGMSAVIGNLGMLADMTDEQLATWAEGAGVSSFIDSIDEIRKAVQKKIEPKGIEDMVEYIDKSVVPEVNESLARLGSGIGEANIEAQFNDLAHLISNPFKLSSEELGDSLELFKTKASPKLDEMVDVIKRGAMLTGSELTSYIEGIKVQYPKYGEEMGKAINLYIANTSGEFEKALKAYPTMLKIAGRDMKQNVHDFEILTQSVGKAGVEGYEEFIEKWEIMTKNADKPMRELMEAIELGLDIGPIVAKMRENGHKITNEMVTSLKDAYDKAATQVRPLTKEVMKASLDALNDPETDLPRTLGNWSKTFDVNIQQAFTSMQNAIDSKTGKLNVDVAKEVLDSIVKQGRITAEQANFVLEASIAASEEGMLKLKGGLLGVTEEVAAASQEIISSTYAGVTADTQASLALVTQALSEGVDKFGANTVAMAEHSKAVFAEMTESQQKTYTRTETLLKQNKGDIDIVAEAIKSKFNNNLELAKQYVEGVSGAMHELKAATDDTANSTNSLKNAQNETYIASIALMYQKAGYSMEAAQKKAEEAAAKISYYSQSTEEEKTYKRGGLVRYAAGGRVPAIVNERGPESLTDKVGAYGKRGAKYPLHHVSMGLPGEGRGGFAIGPDGKPGLAPGTFVNTAASSTTRSVLNHARGGFIQKYAAGGNIETLQAQIKTVEERIQRVKDNPKYNDKVKKALLDGAQDDLDRLQVKLQAAVTASRGTKQHADALAKTSAKAATERKKTQDTTARAKGKNEAVDQKGNVYKVGSNNTLNKEFGTDELTNINGGGYASWTTPDGKKVLLRVNPGGTKQYAQGKGKDGKLIWTNKEAIHKKDRPEGTMASDDTKYYEGETAVPEGAKKHLPVSWDHKLVRSFLTFYRRNMTIPHIKNDPEFMKKIMVMDFGKNGLTPDMAAQLVESLPKYAEGGEVSASELAQALISKNQKVISKFMNFASGGRVPNEEEYISREEIENESYGGGGGRTSTQSGASGKKPSEMTMEELAELNRQKHAESVTVAESNTGGGPTVPGTEEMVAQVEQIAQQRGNAYKKVADAMVALRFTKEQAKEISSGEQAKKMLDEVKEKGRDAPKLPTNRTLDMMAGVPAVVSKSSKNIITAATRNFGSGWRSGGKEGGGKKESAGFREQAGGGGEKRSGGLGQPGGRRTEETQGYGGQSSGQPQSGLYKTARLGAPKVSQEQEDARKRIGWRDPKVEAPTVKGFNPRNRGMAQGGGPGVGASARVTSGQGVQGDKTIPERLAAIYNPLPDNPFKQYLKDNKFQAGTSTSLANYKPKFATADTIANAPESATSKWRKIDVQQPSEGSLFKRQPDEGEPRKSWRKESQERRKGFGALSSKSSETANTSKHRSARLGAPTYDDKTVQHRKTLETKSLSVPKGLHPRAAALVAAKTFENKKNVYINGEGLVKRYKATHDLYKSPVDAGEKRTVVRGLKYIYGKMRKKFGTKEAYYWAKQAQGESTNVGAPKDLTGVLLKGGKKVRSKFESGGLVPSIVGEKGPELLYRPTNDSLYGVGLQGAALQYLKRGDLVLPNEYYNGGTIGMARELYNSYRSAEHFADGGIVRKAVGGEVPGNSNTQVDVGGIQVSVDASNSGDPEAVGRAVQEAVEYAVKEQIGLTVKRAGQRRNGI